MMIHKQVSLDGLEIELLRQWCDMKGKSAPCWPQGQFRPELRILLRDQGSQVELKSVSIQLLEEANKFLHNSCPRQDRNLFSSVPQSCTSLWDPINRSTPSLPVHHQLPEFSQTYVHWVGDVIQPSYPLSSPSPPALSLSQHQGLFKWVSFSHQVAKVLEFQLQHQSY